MNLYFVTIKSGDSFYVVSESTDGAYDKLLKILDEEDMYFSNERKLESIYVIGEEWYGKDVYKEGE